MQQRAVVHLSKAETMTAPKRIAVVCGGYTGEKAISMKSAEMVMNNIDRQKFDPVLVRIERDGWWAQVNKLDIPVDKNDFSVRIHDDAFRFDAALIAIHGTPGEDGKLQGYFDMIGMPYQTGGVLNMALTFDKFRTVSALREGGFQVAQSVVLKNTDAFKPDEILTTIGLPCFVKPTNAGSSLGISRVDEAEQLPAAIEKAFAENPHIMVEAMVSGTEITCGVMRINGKTTALQITEIVSYNSFFDYEAKYREDRREEITPARIAEQDFENCLRTSEAIFDFLDCRGAARVDYILNENGLFCIEINTVPGMSEVSILPQQCEACGMSKTELITQMLEG
ncbi:MAG: D-alanine--D-alanine ligase [Cryomorphaceae bacterium]|nr:MAG: D-alanine--D-alanine ligase [Cryomorphaceae bacterium]